MRTLWTHVFRVSMLLGLAVACASTGSSTFSGTSGPVDWEVINLGRLDAADGSRSRWSYTIVLKETAGTAIQFEHIESGSHASGADLFGGSPGTFEPFNHKLDAHSELRFHAADSWGWSKSAGPQFGGMSRLGALTVERRFTGKDSQGHPVSVTVRVVLDRSVGQLSRRHPSFDTVLPPSRPLGPGELPMLAGKWDGGFEASPFVIPIETTISPDGSAEIAANDPVTSRFSVRLSVRDGKLWYAGDARGSLTLHQGGGERVLAGQLTVATSGTGRPVAIPLRLWAVEAASPTPTERAQHASLRCPFSRRYRLMNPKLRPLPTSVELLGEAEREAREGEEAVPSRALVAEDYLQTVRKKIEPLLFYPTQAMKDGQSGKVAVGFRWRRNGTLASIRIEQSSGFPLLDRSALDAVRCAAPFPPIPDELGSFMTTTSTFTFVLDRPTRPAP